jgi:putative DNA primase/helicase
MKIQKPIHLAKFTTKSERSQKSRLFLPPEFAEDAIAVIFTRESHGDFRYTAVWGRWHRWNGRFWEHDNTHLVPEFVRHVCRLVSNRCPDDKLQRKIASASTVAAVERLARSDRQHAATVDQWDADPWLLNTLGGIIELSTGELRPSRREDYCTKVTAAAPGDACPLWIAFLSRITNGDVELQSYLQRVCGYLLTGSTREQVWFFLYGTGANGKSVFINTIAGVMGDYARTAPIETFTETMFDQHPTDLAGLQGARLVSVVETEEGRAWAESKIKRLTGGDRVPARFMRQDFFEYTPQFKLVVAGNHKPGLRTVDEATRRRLHLVPFIVTIPKAERDPELFEKLKAEWPGILRWMIEGCLSWQREGLNPPSVVLAATEDYLATEDLVARWIEECCMTGPNCTAPLADLYRSYQLWCADNGEAVCSQKRFSQNLEAREFTKVRSALSRMFRGIALRRKTVEADRPA